jgi:uncharacterized protein
MLKPETKALQSQLAQYCRSGQDVESIAAPADRLNHYRRLVYNVTYGILVQAYPITYNLLPSESWKTMVDSFVANHPCVDPQVWKMPRELIDFVAKTGYQTYNAPEFLEDLLKFEWMEIAVYSMPDVEVPAFEVIDDLKFNALCFNPHHQILEIQYPVHQLSKLKPEEHKGQYFILSFRHNSGKVHFVSLSALQAIMIDTLIQNPGVSVLEVLELLALEQHISLSINTKIEILELLTFLHTKSFVLGKLSA